MYKVVTRDPYLIAALVGTSLRAVADERIPPKPLDHLLVHLRVTEHEDVVPTRPFHDHVAALVSHRATRHLATNDMFSHTSATMNDKFK